MLCSGSVPQAFWRVPRVAGEDHCAGCCARPSLHTQALHWQNTSCLEAVPSKLLHAFLDEFACVLVFSCSA